MHDHDVIAVRYATMESTRSRQYFRFSAYGEPDATMDLDYYFWVVAGDDGITLVDTGFSPGGGASRPGRRTLVPAVEALRSLGVEPRDVARVILTHFHYDHIGNVSAFPHARLVVQAAELAFWSGGYAGLPALAAAVEQDEIAHVRDAHTQGRVDVVDGAAQVSPSISVSHVGGHCPGQQIVTVTTPGSHEQTILCSDAVHFYEEAERSMPHHGVFNLQEMLTTYDRTREAAAAGHRVVPGHDPDVMHRYPAVPGLEGLAVRVSPSSEKLQVHP